MKDVAVLEPDDDNRKEARMIGVPWPGARVTALPSEQVVLLKGILSALNRIADVIAPLPVPKPDFEESDEEFAARKALLQALQLNSIQQK